MQVVFNLVVMLLGKLFIIMTINLQSFLCAVLARCLPLYIKYTTPWQTKFLSYIPKVAKRKQQQ